MPSFDVSYAYIEASGSWTLLFYNGDPPDTQVFHTYNSWYYPRWPRCAWQGDSVYIVFPVYDPGPPDGYIIVFVKSSDGGNTFSSPMLISDAISPDEEFNRWCDISVDDAGNIYVVWTLEIYPANDRTIYFRKSVDGGSSFEAKVAVETDDDFAWTKIAAHADGSYVVIGCTDLTAATLVVYSSLDGGDSWSGPFATGMDVVVPTDWHFSYDLEFGGDVLYAASEEGTTLWKGRSTDYGETWAATSIDLGADLARIGVCSKANKFWIVYRFYGGGSVSCHYTLDDFGSWNTTQVASTTSAAYPSIGVSDSELHCIWHDGAYIYRAYSTDEGSSWSTPDTPSTGTSTRSPCVAGFRRIAIPQTYFFLA